MNCRSLLRGATSRRYETRQAKDWKNHVETRACTIRCLKQLECINSDHIRLQLAFNCLDSPEGKNKSRKPHIRAKRRH